MQDWDWTEVDTKNYMLCKEWAVEECKAGVKCPVKEDQTKPNALVLVSDWSTEGTGYIMYQELCKCIKANQPVEQINCWVDQWRIINCGATFNSGAESCFSPVEGELLGIAKALHKARYYFAGQSNIHIVNDHKPLVSFLENTDINEVENRRLVNLRRKCEN